MTANRKRGEVSIELGGEERVLKLDFNAIATLEELHGGTPVHVLLSPGRMGLGVIRDAIFVAIHAGNPRLARIQKVSREKVGEWLSAETERFDALVAALMSVVTAAMPGGGDEDPTKPAEPVAPPADPKAAGAASTSTTSGE